MSSNELPVFSYPFDEKTLKDGSFKALSKEKAVILEISFPSQRVPQLKITTDKFILKTGRLSKIGAETIKPVGKSLADVLKEIPKGESREVPTMTLQMDVKNFAKVDFDFENTTQFKKIADGWFREWAETEFIDFFA